MNQNIDALRTIFYFYATQDEVQSPNFVSLTFAGSHGKQVIAPPKFSNVDISLNEFLFFLEDIGTLKTAITIDDVS
jgi:hypothetical protein